MRKLVRTLPSKVFRQAVEQFFGNIDRQDQPNDYASLLRLAWGQVGPAGDPANVLSDFDCRPCQKDIRHNARLRQRAKDIISHHERHSFDFVEFRTMGHVALQVPENREPFTLADCSEIRVNNFAEVAP